MFRADQPRVSRQAATMLCLALFGFAFAPILAISENAIAERVVYALQWGTPAAIPNFVDLTAGCNWAGIGGQIFNRTGSPMNGLLVKISGTLEGRPILKYVYTGSSQYFGPGGFDLKLADRPTSGRALTLQLLNAAGEPRSAVFQLSTYANCQQNLLVVNLVETSLDQSVYLPLITR
jgi:hypothetical protein